MNGRQNVTRLKGTSLHPDRQEISSIDVYDIVVYYTRKSSMFVVWLLCNRECPVSCSSLQFLIKDDKGQ